MTYGIDIILGYKVTEDDVRELCKTFTDVDIDSSDSDSSDVNQFDEAINQYIYEIFGEKYSCERLKCHSYENGGDWIIGCVVCNFNGFDFEEISDKLSMIIQSKKDITELKKLYRKLKLSKYNDDIEPKYYSMADGCYSCT